MTHSEPRSHPATVARGSILARAGTIGRRGVVLGVVLPAVCAVVLASTLVVAPPDQRTTLVLGALVAMLAGLSVSSVGVFGGILVPGLLLIGVEPLLVAPVSLLLQVAVIPLGAASHHKLGNVARPIAVPLVIGGLGGAVVGVLFVSALAPETVARLIALLIVVVGVVVLATMRFRGLGEIREPSDTPQLRIGAIGALSGFPTAVSGAGWGPVGVTLLILSRFEPRQAVGSSTFGRMFIAVASIALYLLLGKGAALQAVSETWWLLPALWAGAVLAIVPGSLLLARLGRNRATVVVASLSIALAVPTLVFGH